MRNVNINIGDESVYVCSNIIGRVGEHNATRLNFILSPAFLGYQYFLTLEAEGAQPVHTDTLTESDGVVCYTIPFQFLVKGVLLIELSAFDEDRIIKSAIVSFEVREGLEAGEEVPSEPYIPTWYVKVFDEANRAEQEADKAQNSAISAQSAKDEAEAAKTAAQTTLQTLEDGIANGDFKGDPGQDGVDGIDGNDGVNGTNATTTAVATGTTNGLMSSTDKAYLDGLPANLNAKADKDNLITAFTYTPSQVTLPNYPSTDGSPIMTCTAHGLVANDIISFTGATPLVGGVAIPVGKKYRVLMVTGINTFVPIGSPISAKAAGGWNVVKHSYISAITFSNLGVDSSCNEVSVEFKATTVYLEAMLSQFYFTLNGVTSASYCPYKSSAIGGAGVLVSKFVISDCTTGENQGEEIHLCSISLKRISNSVWSVFINSGYKNATAISYYGYVSNASFSTLNSLELLFTVGACIEGTFIIRRG